MKSSIKKIVFPFSQVLSLYFATSAFGNEACKLVDAESALVPVTALSENISCLQEKLNALETELAPFKNAKGAVIAFDRSEAQTADVVGGACPVGWELFRDAGGRMIVGAGQHSNQDREGNNLTSYPAYSDNSMGAIGGAERHELSPEEMPVHRHPISASKKTDVHDGLAGSGDSVDFGIDRTFRINAEEGSWGRLSQTIGSAGESIPHNNMPPFISLYFCKRAD